MSKYKFHNPFANQDDIDQAFINACAVGNFDEVKELLNFEHGSFKANINAQHGAAITYASASGNVDLVKFLLEKGLDIHTFKDSPFKLACEYEKVEVINYFIFQCNIRYTNDIYDYLLTANKTYVENMFKIRGINKDLYEKLEVKNNTNKKIKI